jgi:hypothetical protein
MIRFKLQRKLMKENKFSLFWEFMLFSEKYIPKKKKEIRTKLFGQFRKNFLVYRVIKITF